MHLVFALPEPAKTGRGGAYYIEGLAEGLRSIGVSADIRIGVDPEFSPDAIPVVDGMLLPTLHDRLEALIAAHAVIIVHHIAAAAGRDDASRAQTLSIERAMLQKLRRIVATSEPVAHRLATEFGVTARAIPPGIRNAAPACPDPAAPVILSVGVLTRRKGHHRLLRAASRLRDLPWRLVIAGERQREPDYAAELVQLVNELGLADRVTILPDPTSATLEHEWRRATVFALATKWEGYPSAVAEALQRGIPALVTTGANAESFLPPAAGAICPLDDMPTFGKCLRRMLFDDELRADMVAAARSAGQTLPRWPDRAREFTAFLEQQR